MQLFPRLSALLQWFLGPQILQFILLANRIIAQQFLDRSYSGMYSQRSCPFVLSGFIGDVIESGHKVRWVWKAPSFHSKLLLRNTHHLLPHWESLLLKVEPSSVKVKLYSSSDDMLFIGGWLWGCSEVFETNTEGRRHRRSSPRSEGRDSFTVWLCLEWYHTFGVASLQTDCLCCACVLPSLNCKPGAAHGAHNSDDSFPATNEKLQVDQCTR